MFSVCFGFEVFDHLNLSYLNKNRHVFTKDYDRLLHNITKLHGTKYFCNSCLQVKDERLLPKHKKFVLKSVVVNQ